MSNQTSSGKQSNNEPSYNLEAIKAIPIIDVATEVGMPTRRSGRHYKSLCPWHGDRRQGSFILYPQDNSCYCFSCKEGGTVIDYYMAATGADFKTAVRELGDKFLKGNPHALRRIDRCKRPDPETLRLPRTLMMQTIRRANGEPLSTANTILAYLATQFPAEDVERIAYEYLIGTTSRHGAIFWYMAYDGTVRSGKVIDYLPNGHRDKRRGATWIHSMMTDRNTGEPLPQWKSVFPRGEWKMMTTLFGEHLLHDPSRRHLPVAIVESEKSAIICALHDPRYLWLATGGKTNLAETRLAAVQLQGRDIVLYPDRDALRDRENPRNGKVEAGWPTTAATFAYRDHITVCNDAETIAQEFGISDPKCDIADLYLYERQLGLTTHTPTQHAVASTTLDSHVTTK